MPLYEFRCKECGAIEEHLMKISDDNPVECQKCGKPALQKLLSQTSFVLKGTGWYETDFKGGSKKPSDSTNSSSSSSNDESSTSSNSNTEKKTESSPKPSPSKTDE